MSSRPKQEDTDITDYDFKEFTAAFQSIQDAENERVEINVLLPIRNLITMHLQFDIGCRDRNIPIETCDYKNSLLVEFESFKCSPHGEARMGREPSLDNRHTGQEVSCSYTLNAERDDGYKDTIQKRDDIFIYGINYIDDLVVRYGWMGKY